MGNVETAPRVGTAPKEAELPRTPNLAEQKSAMELNPSQERFLSGFIRGSRMGAGPSVKTGPYHTQARELGQQLGLLTGNQWEHITFAIRDLPPEDGKARAQLHVRNSITGKIVEINWSGTFGADKSDTLSIRENVPFAQTSQNFQRNVIVQSRAWPVSDYTISGPVTIPTENAGEAPRMQFTLKVSDARNPTNWKLTLDSVSGKECGFQVEDRGLRFPPPRRKH